MPKPTAEEIEQREQQAADRELWAERRDRKYRWEELCGLRGGRYASCRLSNYEAVTDAQRNVLERLTIYRDQIREDVEDGRNIVLYGPAGTGKDHLMMAMAGAAIVNEGLTIGWQNVMDWFGDVRDSFDGDRSEAQIIAELSRPDILMLSDPLPPFGKLSDFQANMLFRVIDKRYSMRRPTWVTINCKSRGEAVDRMGMQIVDRLAHDALTLFCDWESYRTK